MLYNMVDDDSSMQCNVLLHNASHLSESDALTLVGTLQASNSSMIRADDPQSLVPSQQQVKYYRLAVTFTCSHNLSLTYSKATVIQPPFIHTLDYPECNLDNFKMKKYIGVWITEGVLYQYVTL